MKYLKRAKDVLKSWRLGDYLRQFSIVAAGVIVTFWGSDLISQHARQKEINSVMQLIIEELQTNQQELQWVKTEIDSDVRMSQLLKKADLQIESIPQDTINKYQAFFSSTSVMSVSADALEVLKSSSLMQHITDKQMLQELLWTYNKLYEIQGGVKSYYSLKYNVLTSSFDKMTKEEAFAYGIKVEGDAHRRFLLQQPNFIFFISSVEYFTNWNEMNRLNNRLTEIIASLRKSYTK